MDNKLRAVVYINDSEDTHIDLKSLALFFDERIYIENMFYC